MNFVEALMNRPRITALMRHLKLEFKEDTCPQCAGDGCLEDGNECPACDHGSGVRIEVVPVKPPPPVLKSLKTWHVKGRGEIKQVIVDSSLFNVIAGGDWKETEVYIDGQPFIVTGVEAHDGRIALGKKVGLLVRRGEG